MTDASPLLLGPIDLRGHRARNRVVIPPMCQYSARDGFPTEWHRQHLSRLACGGPGIVFVEATAIEPRGRITHGDLGIWSDDRAASLAVLASVIRAQGALAAIQIGHAGRKASTQRPWHGNGPIGGPEDQSRGEEPWEIVGPTDAPADAGWNRPRALGIAEIPAIVEGFAVAAKRADAAGFDVLEIHGAHGYLIHSFLSPLSNKRADAYGGDLKGRMRLALEVTEAVRVVWPAAKPLFFRISAVDHVEGGWSIEDSVELARALRARGVDVIDCSSGGISGPVTTVPRAPGFQVPFARRVREGAGIVTEAVGLILDGLQAEAILREGSADLIGVAREALYDPFWTLHAARDLGADPDFAAWPEQYGWWLNRRARSLASKR
jgi:2,4-dienoyl-CoA reductase-like NADH-dependent reductase (Old Yellow Enzyme family)